MEKFLRKVSLQHTTSFARASSEGAWAVSLHRRRISLSASHSLHPHDPHVACKVDVKSTCKVDGSMSLQGVLRCKVVCSQNKRCKSFYEKFRPPPRLRATLEPNLRGLSACTVQDFSTFSCLQPLRMQGGCVTCKVDGSCVARCVTCKVDGSCVARCVSKQKM